jgi:hypothetical protein
MRGYILLKLETGQWPIPLKKRRKGGGGGGGGGGGSYNFIQFNEVLLSNGDI